MCCFMDKEIKTIQKNKLSQIKIKLTEYMGHQLVDLRVYFQTEEGESIPTKKGITFKVDLLPEVIQALITADESREG